MLANQGICSWRADPFFTIQRSWLERIILGKVNYCVNALIEAGWMRARNFCNSRNKLAYAYLLTPKGIEQKAVIAMHFLRRKVVGYQVLENEIVQLRREVDASPEHKPQ
jgi:EPS-associated MarR family transcriptional regulator